MPITADSITKRLSKLKGQTGVMLKLAPDKTTKVRMVPTEGDPFNELHFHYGLGKHRTVLCPNGTFGKDCPICELVFSLYRDGDPEFKDQANKLRAKMRTFIPVLVRGEEKKQSGDYWVRYLGLSQTSYERILNLAGNLIEKYNIDITDPNKGRDLLIETEKKSFDGRTATVVKQIDPDMENSLLIEDIGDVAKIVEAIPDVSELGEEKSYEDLKKIVDEISGKASPEHETKVEDVMQETSTQETNKQETNKQDNIEDIFNQKSTDDVVIEQKENTESLPESTSSMPKSEDQKFEELFT